MGNLLLLLILLHFSETTSLQMVRGRPECSSWSKINGQSGAEIYLPTERARNTTVAHTRRSSEARLSFISGLVGFSRAANSREPNGTCRLS